MIMFEGWNWTVNPRTYLLYTTHYSWLTEGGISPYFYLWAGGRERGATGRLGYPWEKLGRIKAKN